MTVDLGIVHRRSADNVSRLLRVLADLDAVYRHDPRRLRPRESHLMSPGHQLLVTTHGDLDCLERSGRGQRTKTSLRMRPSSKSVRDSPSA